MTTSNVGEEFKQSLNKFRKGNGEFGAWDYQASGVSLDGVAGKQPHLLSQMPEDVADSVLGCLDQARNLTLENVDFDSIRDALYATNEDGELSPLHKRPRDRNNALIREVWEQDAAVEVNQAIAGLDSGDEEVIDVGFGAHFAPTVKCDENNDGAKSYQVSLEMPFSDDIYMEKPRKYETRMFEPDAPFIDDDDFEQDFHYAALSFAAKRYGVGIKHDPFNPSMSQFVSEADRPDETVPPTYKELKAFTGSEMLREFRETESVDYRADLLKVPVETQQFVEDLRLTLERGSTTDERAVVVEELADRYMALEPVVEKLRSDPKEKDALDPFRRTAIMAALCPTRSDWQPSRIEGHLRDGLKREDLADMWKEACQKTGDYS